MTSSLIVHPLEPVFSNDSHTLLLGTMPSPKSREYGFYYMHPQNRFWKVIALVYGETLQYENGAPSAETRRAAIDERKSLILRHGLALWDVLHSCDITGAGDATIRNPVPNDLSIIITAAPITRIICTGTTAYSLFIKLHGLQKKGPVLQKDKASSIMFNGIEVSCLPSTSPANQGRWPLDKLISVYRATLVPSLS